MISITCTIDITGTSIIQANSQQVALLANNDMNNLNQGIITASFGQIVMMMFQD